MLRILFNSLFACCKTWIFRHVVCGPPSVPCVQGEGPSYWPYLPCALSPGPLGKTRCESMLTTDKWYAGVSHLAFSLLLHPKRIFLRGSQEGEKLLHTPTAQHFPPNLKLFALLTEKDALVLREPTYAGWLCCKAREICFWICPACFQEG